MAKIRLTDEQLTAVTNRGGSLLVSAAAGSGKTKVLVERLFSYMMEEKCHVDDFLIITFTKAAASELRGKIAAELSRRVAEEPDDPHLRKQLFRVYQADIKTVDAFCVALLRENAHLLRSNGNHSLTPDFRVMDEAESLLMQQRVLKQVLEQFYTRLQEGDKQAELLAETLGAGRDDRALESLVLELHGKVQSHAYPGLWLEDVKKSWQALPDQLAGSVYGRALMEDTVRRAEFWVQRLTQAVEDMVDCPPVYNAYADRFLEVAEQLRGYRQAAQQGWEAMSGIQPVFRRMGVVRGEENALWKQRAKTVLEQCKKELKKLGSTFTVTEEEHLADLRHMAPAMQALVQLTADFIDAYQKEKLRRNAMDFSDQEHYAIELLTQPDGTPTQLASQISERYREIMVDEYQDTNEVQNWIFRAISREGKNLFVVGDVKQSIYRFRLADPTIFLEKYLRYLPAAEAKDGEERKVLLSRNFRSRKAVLETTNFIFRNIMSPQMGEMEYGAEEQLYFGAEYYLERNDADTEFHLISVLDTEDEQFDRTQVEADFVAHRIRQLLDEKYPVQGEDGTMRPVRAEDIVILMRSPRARERAFTDALARENIPCTTSENESLFATMEIAVLFSLLQIIDNPRQDVPLISVLRSPLFGFTPDRLAQIRALVPEGDYYDALCADTAEDSIAFCKVLQQLRNDAMDMSVDRLVWEIYTKLHVQAVFGAMEDGHRRKEHLMAFYAYTGQVAGTGKRSVFDFVAHLHRLLESDRAPALHTKNSGSGVQIMSIHKSKGLEFPVVILADLHKNFNTEDFRHPVLVHPKLGLGTECVDLQRKIRYDTVSKTALTLQLQRESKAEEMRILYVAMTRAKEKLILVDCMKHAYKHVRDLTALSSLPVDPEAVRSCNSPGDWLLLPLLSTYEAGGIHQWADMEPSRLQETTGGWQIRFWENPTSYAAEADMKNEEPAEETACDLALLHRPYAYAKATEIPTKLTATQLKGRALDAELQTEHVAPLRRETLQIPRFLQEDRGLSAAEKGTAMHLAMQYLDFDTPMQESAVRAEVAQMAEKRLLTPQQAESVDYRKLAVFLASPLAERIRHDGQALREYPFTLLVNADDYMGEVEGEELLLQGVVDCCFHEDGKLVVVDFKTDRIRPGEEAQRAAVYRGQLDAYSKALEKILQSEVKEKILYFFATDTAYTLD
ncbi:MAG: helicase-exonuclease AddAB subunit AddA [Ruminococcaceae bacterium]|nr:helicase-exonuclease AddAB subunit AddA [Oscillospiraceae bacterium]